MPVSKRERNTGSQEQGKDSNSPSVKFIIKGGFRPPFFCETPIPKAQ
jgi:hypothetical protein